MPATDTGNQVNEALLSNNEHAADREQTQQTTEPASPPSAAAASANPLPSQTGTIKILALVLVVVALLVTAAALLSKSGVVQPGGPPPECRKSASLAVLRQEEAATSSNNLADNGGLLQLIVWGGKGKKAGLVFDDSYLLNLQDRKWRSVQQKAGLMLNSMPGLRNIWKSSASQQALQTDPAHLPAARWKQLSVTDAHSSSMVVFGGDGQDADDHTLSRDDSKSVHSDADNRINDGHNYFNDAWQVSLDRGKARWQELWNIEPNGVAPAPRRAAAGALFSLNTTTSKWLLIHGGRLEAGHILDDLWLATLGAGNITYQQLWPPQKDTVLGKQKKAPGPAARKGHVAVAIEDRDACMVIFGGRNGMGYFNDVWAYRLSTAQWEDWTPDNTQAPAPMGRDHFGAVYDAGHVYIYGGRGGSTYGKSRPLDDVWRFTVASQSWTQLKTSGRAPLARFLFGYDIFYPVLHQHDQPEQEVQMVTQADDMLLKAGQGQALAADSNETVDSGYASMPDRSDSTIVKSKAAHADSKYDGESATPTERNEGKFSSGISVAETLQGAEATVTAGGQNKGPAGSMIVFGGESLKGCYLNDVWVLHLNSLLWQEVSKPVACQKRCRSMLEQN